MKKTWISIKRGFLQPEHRTAMGIRVWLYMFIIDQADWETGQVLDWKDQAAADELAMPLSTLRQQRQELETLRYIDCVQEGNHQRIIINKWIDPRSYSGKVMNDNSKGEVKGNNKGNNKGTETSSPLHSTQISNIKDQDEPNFIGKFIGTSCIQFNGLTAIDQIKEIEDLARKYGEVNMLEMAAWCRDKEIRNMNRAISAIRTMAPSWSRKEPTAKDRLVGVTNDGELWQRPDGSSYYKIDGKEVEA